MIIFFFVIIIYFIFFRSRKFKFNYIEHKKIKKFCQGYIYHDGNLIESSGLYNFSNIVKYSVKNPTLIKNKLKLPNNIFAEGIAKIDDKILLLTWKEDKAFILDYDTLKIIKEIKGFNYKFNKNEGWGCTYDYDRNRIIVTDGSNKLYFLDSNKFNMISMIETKYNKLNEIEYGNGYILANVWKKDFILKMDPINGKIIEKITFPFVKKNKNRGVLNGIAYNKKDNLWYITGKNWSFFYEITI
jgi:glutaminyl-peptide cyclotransferase